VLEYKPDWEETKERFQLWWDHGYYGRCGLAVYAPRNDAPDVPPPPGAESPEQKWFDLEWISRQNEYHLGRSFYGGEVMPIWTAGYAGVTGIPALLGCPYEADMDTGWSEPILTDPDDFDVRRIRMDDTTEWYVFMLDMLRRATGESRGKYLPSMGAFGGGGDTLAALRGTEQLLIDCLERPDEVRDAEEYLMDMWMEFYDRCYEAVDGPTQGSTCWFPLWSPGKFYPTHNDFSYNIGPEMFREIFLPAIRRQTEFLDHSVYHVDGVNAFAHVDALCELPQLQALQILPGAGQPSPLYYEDVLKKVQVAGKNLHINIAPDDVEPALSMLSARGLFIATAAETQAQAEELLAQAERLSVDRG
jgi:hypothetical protein